MPAPLGQLLRRARLREGLTQADLGKKIRYAGASVSHWENGTVNISKDLRAKIEKILGPLNTQKSAKRSAADEQAASIMENEVSSFGIWLRKARNNSDMSVPELSTIAGISPAAIYNIESGKIKNPQPYTRNQLSNALKQNIPDEVIADTEADQKIQGLGNLTDFEPHDKGNWPQCPGVYVLYDVSERPVYVGKAENIAKRLKQHEEKFWFRNPIVTFGSFIEVSDSNMRHQLEQVMIKFLKSNAVINQQSVESFEE